MGRHIRHIQAGLLCLTSNYVQDTCVPGEFLPRQLPLCEDYAYFQASGPKKAEWHENHMSKLKEALTEELSSGVDILMQDF